MVVEGAKGTCTCSAASVLPLQVVVHVVVPVHVAAVAVAVAVPVLVAVLVHAPSGGCISRGCCCFCCCCCCRSRSFSFSFSIKSARLHAPSNSPYTEAASQCKTLRPARAKAEARMACTSPVPQITTSYSVCKPSSSLVVGCSSAAAAATANAIVPGTNVTVQ